MSSGFWNCRLCDSEPVACHESSQLMQCSSDDCEMRNVSLSPKAWNAVMNLSAVKSLFDSNTKLNKELSELEEGEHEAPVYVCMSCGHEGDPDNFGSHCPSCGIDLDEMEKER